MRSVIAIAALLPGAFAIYNTKVCGGVGGCVGTTWNPPNPFRCPDGTLLNIQQFASESIAADGGNYEIVPKSQFPTSCQNGSKPGDRDILTVHTTQFGQKLYQYITETCNTQTVAQPGNCYSANPNPSKSTPCQLVDTTGKTCVGNPKAGECERWGSAAGRTQCIGWTVDKPEPPTTN